MNPKLILPNNAVLMGSNPVFFLAGPIRGGGDWQKKAIYLLAKEVPDAYIVCPCRYTPNHELYRFSVPPSPDEEWKKLDLPSFPRQTLWERYYLDRASKHGSIIFWL